MSTRMDYEGTKLDTNQKLILKKFRFNLQDVITSDHTDAVLLKWLRTYNFDLKKTERIFREVDSCRKVYRLNTITDTYIQPEVFQKYSRNTFLGFAKDGSAIRYYNAHVDYFSFLHSVSLIDLFLFFVYNMESDLKKIKEKNEKSGQNNSKITFIIDCDGFSYTDIFYKAVIDAGLEIFTKYQLHYPESWSVFLFVNAPYMFDKVLTIFKPAFKSKLLDSFHSASKSSTSTLLKKYIDEDTLPVFLGGTRVDSTGDPRCRELINEFRKIPEKYYLTNAIHFIDETDPDVKVAVLRPWSVYNVPVVVKEAGVKIRVEIRSEESVYLTILQRNLSSDSESFNLPEPNVKLDPEDESSNVRIVVTRTKCYMQISPLDISVYAHWSGVYIFYLENASSWLAPKKIYYRITVSRPDS